MHTISDGHAPGEKYFFTQLAQIYEIETKEVLFILTLFFRVLSVLCWWGGLMEYMLSHIKIYSYLAISIQLGYVILERIDA